MLLRLGIVSSIYRNRKAAGLKLMPDGRGGHKRYPTQAVHELVIANENLVRYAQVDRICRRTEARTACSASLLRTERTVNRERFDATVQCD